MSTPTGASVAAQVRQERLRLGWTQRDLAARAGLPAISYARFERSGGIPLDRLLAILSVLGLSLALSPAAGAPALPAAGTRVRQRGIRRAPPAPDAAAARAKSGRPAAPAPASGQPAAVTPRPPIDAAALAHTRKQYRDAIIQLVSTIVLNKATNYTSGQSVRNVMRAKNIDDSGKPAFVGAVEAELNRLTVDNCVAYGISPAAFETWSKTWRTDIGIYDALD